MYAVKSQHNRGPGEKQEAAMQLKDEAQALQKRMIPQQKLV